MTQRGSEVATLQPPRIEVARAEPGRRPIRLAKLGVWAIGLLPLLLTAADLWRDTLGANPIEALTHRTGFWALVLLLATLGVTPLRRITGWNAIIQIRRPLGLFAFFYAALHLAIFVGVDHAFAVEQIVTDVLERPYVTAGMAAFLLLVPLAATSTRGMVRRLGGRRWQLLHRLVYPAAGLAVLHFVWLVKADLRRPLTFGFILLVLLLLRLLKPRRSSGTSGFRERRS
jgi:methionine sulfoxide reductase heme-binding subunit